MSDKWQVLSDGRQHLGTGEELGQGLQPFYAACGQVELVRPQRPEMAARVCGRCKAAVIRGAGK